MRSRLSGASGIDSQWPATLRAFGECARVCPRMTDAFARDIRCFVGIESAADHTADQHRTALNLIASPTGTVASSGNLLHDRHGGPLD
jgi:isochorismate hydrolase